MDDGDLYGRRDECAALDRMVTALRDGESRVLVLRGEPGIGKTALLAHAGDTANGVRVLRAAGIESEMELAFASLHQLCLPLLDRMADLPQSRREALETVFRMRAGSAPDPFLAGLGVLELLSNASADGPLLCLIDDAQWLDRASAQILGFVARRLLSESVGFIFGARVPGPELSGLPELEITGLRDADARSLLDSASQALLDRSVHDRIVAETHGNPLALLELTRGLTPTRLAGGLGLVSDSLPGLIEGSFADRVAALPEPERLLLLIAAAEPAGDPDLVIKAAVRLGVRIPAALNGVDGLLTIADRVTFRHPLVRSAVYRAAEPGPRRAAHLALAEVTDPRDAADRRAWHLAAAATGPDEAVAAELERSAGRAQARGGVAAAAAFLQRSVALTRDPARRTDRVLAAAEASFQVGDLDDVGRLLGAFGGGPLDGLQSGRADVLRGQLAYASGGALAAITLLREAAGQFEAGHPRLARETYLTAWGMAVSVADPEALLAVSRAVRALPPPDDPGPLDLLLDGVSLLVTQGRAAAAATLQRAARAVVGIPPADVLRWGWVATIAGAAVWDDEITQRIYTRQVQVVRDAGALRELPYHLSSLGYISTWTGDFATAASAIAEADTVAAATGNPVPPYAALRLLSLRGRESEAAELVRATVRSSRAAGFGMGVTAARWAGAVLYNGLARYPEAMRAARAEPGIHEPMLSTWVLVELVEAAAAAGERAVAREAFGRLAKETEPFGTDFARGIEARSRALVVDDADAAHREAIERLGRTRLRPDLARAHLLYGEWLRRRNESVEARDQLRTAYEMFVTIGMEAFADRARRELLAAGETVGRRTVVASLSPELTSQERQIALLVRDGLSNPEVGARLFISPRTVEWHLRRIFVKLSLDSRHQLRELFQHGDD